MNNFKALLLNVILEEKVGVHWVLNTAFLRNSIGHISITGKQNHSS